MLNLDVKKRPSVEEALEHRFFHRYLDFVEGEAVGQENIRASNKVPNNMVTRAGMIKPQYSQSRIGQTIEVGQLQPEGPQKSPLL